MAVTKNALDYLRKMFGGKEFRQFAQDEEFEQIFNNFAYDEVINQDGQQLAERTRFMAILATLLGCGGQDEFKLMAEAALNCGLEAIEIKEIIYQATAYLGIGRTYPFFLITNALFLEKNIVLKDKDLESDCQIRQEKGTKAQVDIMGERMIDFYKSGPLESRHINYWLADNCFGDYYTRGILSYQDREMITFCFLLAQGGCEPQLTSHVKANMRIGNDKAFLIKVISQCLPYIGYPRSLNALNCVNQAYNEVQNG